MATASKYTSKGQRPNVNKKILNSVKAESDKMMNAMHSWKTGHNPWVTVANPDVKETAKKNIRVRAHDHWGVTKKRASF